MGEEVHHYLEVGDEEAEDDHDDDASEVPDVASAYALGEKAAVMIESFDTGAAGTAVSQLVRAFQYSTFFARAY